MNLITTNIAKIIRFGVGVLFLSLAGCNMATPTSEVPTPYISSAKYEQLDCSTLKGKIEELDQGVNRMTVAQNDRVYNSGGHMAFYGWGSGDGYETIELAKMKGELDASNRVFDKKCASTLNNTKH